MRGAEQDPAASGVTWTDVTVVPGLRPRMRTTTSQAPRRWVEEGVWGPVTATLALDLEDTAAGCRVLADFRVRALGLGGPVTLLARRAVTADLRRAARLVADAD